MGENCPHLLLVLKVDKNRLLLKSEGVCTDCKKRGKLWGCLQDGCQYIGCSESDMDHSTKHYKEFKHAIAVNLSSFRIWCYACQNEVKLPSAFTSADMKALKRARKHGTTNKDNVTNHNTEARSANYKRETSQTKSSDQSNREVDPQNYDSRIPVGLTGLRNMGNTCYMNSALQAISNCLPLTHYFLQGEDRFSVEMKPSMSKQYFKLINDMWNPAHNSYLAPNGVHMALKSINPSFRGYHQQDAQEFLRCLMDRLHEELKYPVPRWTDQSSTPSYHPIPEPMDVDDNNVISSNDVPAPSGGLNVNLSNASSTESFHSVASEMEDENFISHHAALNTPAASPASHMTTSYDNLSQLHGQDPAAGENRSVDREELPWTQHFGQTQNPVSRPAQEGKPQPKKPTYQYRSVISEVFDGELRSSVQCLTCDQVSHTRETFQDLSLPIPGKDDLARLHGTTGFSPASGSVLLPVVPGFKGPCSDSQSSTLMMNIVWNMWDWVKSWLWGPQVTLNDCLSAFFSADELKGDNMYSCEKCRKLRNGVKYCRLLQLPEVLCIHLKRFRHEYMMSYSSKITSPVVFPTKGLDLRPFLAQDSPSICTNYDLCSVIVHMGNAGGGHYTTYARNFTNQKWYEFDDQFVTNVSESTVANAEAYVLFYCKSSFEAKRARDHISNLYQEEQEKLALIRGPVLPRSLLQFYVSFKWINKFTTFVEPGPIDNSDFVCRHLDILPESYDCLDQLTIRVTENVWRELHARFGGGPAMVNPTLCRICTEEFYSLQERRSREKEMFLKLNQLHHEDDSSSSSVYICLEWFREWEAFLNGKLPEPPGEIDNMPISITKEGKHFLKKNSSHAPITEQAWRFLISVYGGGPTVSVRPRHTSSTSPVRKGATHRSVKTGPLRKVSPNQRGDSGQRVSKEDGTTTPHGGKEIPMNYKEKSEKEEGKAVPSSEGHIETRHSNMEQV